VPPLLRGCVDQCPRSSVQGEPDHDHRSPGSSGYRTAARGPQDERRLDRQGGDSVRPGRFARRRGAGVRGSPRGPVSGIPPNGGVHSVPPGLVATRTLRSWWPPWASRRAPRGKLRAGRRPGGPNTRFVGHPGDHPAALTALASDLWDHPDRPLTQLIRSLLRPPSRTTYGCHARSSFSKVKSRAPADPSPAHSPVRWVLR